MIFAASLREVFEFEEALMLPTPAARVPFVALPSVTPKVQRKPAPNAPFVLPTDHRIIALGVKPKLCVMVSVGQPLVHAAAAVAFFGKLPTLNTCASAADGPATAAVIVNARTATA